MIRSVYVTLAFAGNKILALDTNRARDCPDESNNRKLQNGKTSLPYTPCERSDLRHIDHTRRPKTKVNTAQNYFGLFFPISDQMNN